MTHIVIRCDASMEIGSGHVIRCRTLARELQRCGAEIVFLCRRQSGDLISLLEQDFTVLALPEQPLRNCDGLEGRELYGSWLGCGQDQDAFQCLQALAVADIKGVSWLIADHYGLDARWETELLDGLSGSGIRPNLLVLDDLADRAHLANCLLDQNFFGSVTESRYELLVPDYCHLLLGPNHALLAPEYAMLHSLVPSRTELKRVLVYFGGVDPLNFNHLSLEALSDFRFEDLAVDIVIGQLDENFESISQLASSRPNTTIHSSLPSLAGLIARADLSIGAGGATTWERSCLHLPSVVVPTASNQSQIIQALDDQGFIRQFGVENTVEDLKELLLNLSRLYPIADSKLGYSLTDGCGAQRIAKIMLDQRWKN